MRLALVPLLIVTTLGWSEDQKSDPKLPRDAQVLLDGYGKVTAKIEDEFKRKLGTEREKLYTALDKSCKDAAKKGDVDGAIAIKSEMKKLMDQVQKGDATDMLGIKKDLQIVSMTAIPKEYQNRVEGVPEVTASSSYDQGQWGPNKCIDNKNSTDWACGENSGNIALKYAAAQKAKGLVIISRCSQSASMIDKGKIIINGSVEMPIKNLEHSKAMCIGFGSTVDVTDIKIIFEVASSPGLTEVYLVP